MDKSKLRSKILKLRKKNFNESLKINCEKFFSFFQKHKFNLKNLGGYYPSNFEIDDLEILEFLEKKNCKISLPIIKKNNQMDFFKWSKNDPLKINKYGIPEPVSSKIFYPDILLVPLVAYDNHLNSYKSSRSCKLKRRHDFFRPKICNISLKVLYHPLFSTPD